MRGSLVRGSKGAPLCRVSAALLSVLPLASFVPIAPFVSDGSYARARATAADCGRTFIPALDDRDRADGERPWPARFVTWGQAGNGLAYRYRPADFTPATYRLEADTAYPYAPRSPTTRLESVELPGRAITVASTSNGSGCTRLAILVTPAVLQVGVRGTTVVSDPALAAVYSALGRGSSQSVTTPTINPDTITGTVRIEVYQNGEPAANQSVTVWTDARGQPGLYGITVGHEHVVVDAPQPTIRLDGQGSPGAKVVVQTDYQGEAQLTIRPGWRGGPEAVLAQTTLNRAATQAARAVVVRHRVFVDFAGAFGYSAGHLAPVSPSFPFILTGYSDRHHYTHFIQQDHAGDVRAVLGAIWNQDPGRIASTSPHYFVLGAMSLEYGGLFDLDDDDCDTPTSTSAYLAHNVGLDLDVSPCYSQGADGTQRLSAGDCQSAGSSVLQIDERTLTARVIGDLGGAVFKHGADGAPYAYHIRLPEAD